VALGWVVEYCRQRNATLRLYGTGWESHPIFAPYAAGFLAPGEEMRAVYQASEINLQLLEWGFQHSRGLDGLASGGFFLFRACPELREHDRADELITYMSWRALSTGCVTFGQLEASRDPMIAAGWEVAKKRIPIGKPDEVCQMLDRWRPVEMDNEYVPVEEITFHSQAEFDAMADDFLANPDRRRAVAAKMRQAVAERFSYDARWRKFLAGIASGLRESAAEAAAKPARQAA
jgi:Glycosyl transferases group 1